MLLIAENNNGKLTQADFGTKNQKYYCPFCGEELILKQGLVKIPHFAHKANSNCKFDYWEPESQRHLEMKKMVMEKVTKHNKCIIAEYEHQIDNLIADVYFEIVHRSDSFKVAVECQCSPKSLWDFIDKTRVYTDMGVHTLWLFDFPEKWRKTTTRLHDEIRTTKPLQEMHKWYYGRIYSLWEDKLLGVHFDSVYRDREVWDPDEGTIIYEYRLKDVRTPNLNQIRSWKLLPFENSGMKFKNDYYLLTRFFDKKWWW